MCSAREINILYQAIIKTGILNFATSEKNIVKGAFKRYFENSRIIKVPVFLFSGTSLQGIQ